MITKKKLLQLLHRWNWKEFDTGIERPLYVQNVLSFIERKEVLVLKGIRRCGKSTLLRQVMKQLTLQGVDPHQVLYINLEDYELRDSMKLDFFDKLLTLYKEKFNPKKKCYFFIDEIQVMPEWERFVRTKYDLNENIKFILSGSNASLLSKELSTLLTGRIVTFEIHPLNYLEYKTFTLTPTLEEYILYGGFPEVVLEKEITKKRILLQQYFEDIIYKDVIQRIGARNNDKVMDLARYLVENSGARLSINKLSRALNIENKTVEKYISAMREAYVLMRTNHFSYSLKKRFDAATQPKYYVVDNGFFQITSLGYTDDEGKRFENAVAIQVNNTYKDVTYWRERTECDFITPNKAINVTVVVKNIPAREFQGLVDFKKKHKKHELVLITPSQSYERHKDVALLSFQEFCETTK